MYKIPPIYKGKTIFILGGGPTLLELLNGVEINNNPVIGINNAFRLGEWVDVLWFADSRFYWWYRKDIDQFNGLKLTYDRHPELMGSVKRQPCLHVVNGRSGHGLSFDRINFNASSGGSSINVAFHLGAKRVILLGFDMRFVDGISNWWDYDTLVPKRVKGYDNFVKPFYQIKKDADKYGLEILNGTPDSALTMFKKVDFHAHIE